MEDKFKMYPTSSSNITAIGYSEEDSKMKVIFKGGNTYLYENVELEVFNMILKSESKGKILNEVIIKNKEKYKYTKLN